MKKILLLISLMLVLLAAFAQAEVEIHIKRGDTDTDAYYETIGGIENSDGSKGGLAWYTTSKSLSSVAYGFYYSGSDSMTPYYPTYSWTTLTNPTSLSLQDDEVSGVIYLGFNTRFYDNGNSSLYNQVRVSSNGFLTFADSTVHGCCQGQNLPYSDVPNNLVAGWWEDLRPASGGGAGTIKYQQFGSSPNKYFVLEFNDVAHYGDNNKKVSFQIKLFED
ncbi:hypothetical protein HY494_01285 [Candidatus Woesearchaeota archaeon]|nr:hypothetical protein [Candidatus Woesearchaeota archaeon]